MTSEFKISKVPDIKAIGKELLSEREKILAQQMELAATEIVQRTQSGHSVNGSTFEPYSEGYRKYKSKRGRRTTPDLTFTGHMLGSLTTKIINQGAYLLGQIFFSSSREADKAKYNQKSREFFGLSKQQIDKLTKALNKQ